MTGDPACHFPATPATAKQAPNRPSANWPAREKVGNRLRGCDNTAAPHFLSNLRIRQYILHRFPDLSANLHIALLRALIAAHRGCRAP